MYDNLRYCPICYTSVDEPTCIDDYYDECPNCHNEQVFGFFEYGSDEHGKHWSKYLIKLLNGVPTRSLPAYPKDPCVNVRRVLWDNHYKTCLNVE